MASKAVSIGNCILCGKCSQVCPLFSATRREELSPRAKAHLATLLLADPQRLQEQDVASLTGLCLGCGRCRQKCPQGVDVPKMVAQMRANHPNFRGWVWKTWLNNAQRLWRPSTVTAQHISDIFQSETISRFLKPLTIFDAKKRWEPFVELDDFSQEYQGQTMILFSGCTGRFLQSSWHQKATNFLSGLGIKVKSATFSCCGLGLSTAGFAREAAKGQQKNIHAWRSAGKPPIVTVCTSCHAGLAAHASLLDTKEEAAQWLKSLVPLSTLLRTSSFVLSQDAPARIGYHRPCHVDKTDSDYSFLAALLAHRLSPPEGKNCCGFGGIVRLKNAALANEVSNRCWQGLSKMDLVLTGCSACTAQLGASAPQGVQAGHWLDIFADISS